MEGQTVIGRFEVKDFATWRAAFDRHQPEREEAGLVSSSVYRRVDAPGVVFMILEWGSEAQAKAYIEAMQLKAKMMVAGVVGVPQFHFVTKA
jgi:quinol monooxygenase YgiN